MDDSNRDAPSLAAPEGRDALSWADLHLHSRFSDGEWTPEKIVRAARRADLGAIAITDHDDVRSYAPASEAGAEHGVEVLSGVEVSSWRAGVDVHILGYGFDPANPALTALLSSARSARVDRADRMVERLAELGVPIAREAVVRIADDASGGMYPSVPSTDPCRVSLVVGSMPVSVSTFGSSTPWTFAIPQSSTYTSPKSPSMMLAGFRSR
jgi:hypothetical protein